MRLSDIMGGAGLTVFPEIGLIIFLAVFAAIVWRIYFRRHAIDLEAHGRIPLNDQSSTIIHPHSARESHESA